MGNNNVAFHRHSGSLPFPCHLQLGRYASINLTIFVSKKGDDGSYASKAEVSYTVEGSTCNLMLTKLFDKNGHVNLVAFLLHDSIACLDRENICLHLRKTETGFVTVEFKSDSVTRDETGFVTTSIAWTKRKKKVDAWGGVTDTKIYLYGSANRCGLLVWECKKNDGHELAKTVTMHMAHYFVSSNGTRAVSERTDIGFSVVVKVGVFDGKYDFTVEGPERHPVSALLYMFDEVNRSGIWKPSMCPHCGNIRRNMSSLQSDSEDSDGRQRNAVRICNTDGRFNGHAGGASIRCRDFYAFS